MQAPRQRKVGLAAAAALGGAAALSQGSNFIIGGAQPPLRAASAVKNVGAMSQETTAAHPAADRSQAGANGGVNGVSAAAAAAAAGLAARFSGLFKQRSTRKKQGSSVAVAGAAGMGNSGGSVSSSSSSFMGGSMAGSVTSAAPSRSASAATSMTMLFERFNEKALKAIMGAQQQARKLGQNFVSSEMILVGIVTQETGPSGKVLKKLGINSKETVKIIEALIGRGDGLVPNEIPFTPAAKRLLASGVQEAKNLKSELVDPIHILMAIAKLTEEESGVISQVFEKLKMDRGTLIEAMETELQELSDLKSKDDAAENLASGGPPKAGAKGEKGKTKALEEFGKDLTEKARKGEMDPLVGREEQIERAIQILARRQKNNPVLIGEPGVGKTAIAEGLAYRIVSGDVPDMLLNKRIIELDMGSLLSGSKYRGEFEERMKNIIQEVKDDPTIILMIDEIHTLIGAGGGGDGGAMDAANILKPALSRGTMQLIGATTIEEYRKHVQKDKALERRFQPVEVPEPTVEETIRILRGLARKYEAHHRLKYSDAALEACVKFASQYIQDRFLPDKAIDVLDETGARVQLRQLAKMPESASELRSDLRELEAKKENAVKLQDFALAADLKQQEDDVQLKIFQLLKEARSGVEPAPVVPLKEGEVAPPAAELPELTAAEIEEALTRPIVTENDVAGVVSTWTGVPVEKVSADESGRLVALEDTLHKRVIGQEEAVTAISKAVRRARAGLKNPNRPIASFIFCGPTGVGKTELCKALSTAYFGQEEAMVRLDMSEYMERHTVSKLIGSPPGYVGYDEESQLTDAVRRKPYSLVLFDEVEKAHPDVFNLMLQILEDGHLTDSKGRTVSFKNTLIILTSNCGAKEIEKTLLGTGGIGFGTGEDEGGSQYARLKAKVSEQLKGFFRPEFLNRLDEIIVFKSLNKQEVREISELEFRKTFMRCQERGITLSLTDRFKTKVVDEGYDPVYGARPLRRAIMRMLDDHLAESFLYTPTVEGECIICDLDQDEKVIVLRQTLSEVNEASEDSTVTVLPEAMPKLEMSGSVSQSSSRS